MAAFCTESHSTVNHSDDVGILAFARNTILSACLPVASGLFLAFGFINNAATAYSVCLLSMQKNVL